MAGAGWAWTAYDWDEGRLFNYVGDAQNTFPIWNATALVALDVYEHAYFLDYRTDRASYIDAFFDNLDWAVVNGWIQPVRHQPLGDASGNSPVRVRRLSGREPAVRLLARVASSKAWTSAASGAGTSEPRTCGGRTARASG